MDSRVITSTNFENNINELISFYKKNDYPIEDILNRYNDIRNTLLTISHIAKPTNLLGSIPDYKYSSYRFFLSKRYNYKIFVKAYPEQNIIKAICLTGKRQLFHPNMFIEQKIITEQLRQAFAEFGCDYDEANKEYLVEATKQASMSETDKLIEYISSL